MISMVAFEFSSGFWDEKGRCQDLQGHPARPSLSEMELLSMPCMSDRCEGFFSEPHTVSLETSVVICCCLLPVFRRCLHGTAGHPIVLWLKHGMLIICSLQ